MKVLAIDDQDEALKQIEKAVTSSEAPDGKPYEVAAVRDHKQALARLDAERFDVVITDMVMGTEEDEGMAVLRKLTGLSPITIVLTAFPSIPNSVEAMRAGAWDYLEKMPVNGSDPYENLLASLGEACRVRLANPEAGRAKADLAWVQQHMDELLTDHPGEVVAVLDRRVVGHDPSYGALEGRMKEQYPVARPMIVSIPDMAVETVG